MPQQNYCNKMNLLWRKYGKYCVSAHDLILFRLYLCQKLLFLHQLTHNMTTDCSLNCKFNTWKFQAQNMGRTCCVQKLFLTFRTISVHNMFSPSFPKRRASDKDLPVQRLFLNIKLLQSSGISVSGIFLSKSGNI